MRAFNDFEKKIIEYLCNSPNSCEVEINGIFRNFLKLNVHLESGITYAYPRGNKMDYSLLEPTADKIHNIYFLIKLLEKENYILIYSRKENRSLVPVPNLKLKEDLRLSEIVTEFISENYFGSIFVSENLKEFYQNGFKDREQINFEKTYKQTDESLTLAKKSIFIAKFSTGLAILVSIISIIISIYYSCKQIELSKSQIEESRNLKSFESQRHIVLEDSLATMIKIRSSSK